MNRLASSLARVAADLDELGVAWALVGGLAVSTWAEPRLTRDIDIAVAVNDDREAERIVRELRRRGYQPLEIVEDETAKRLATARLSLQEEQDGIVIDLLFASSGIERETVAQSRMIDVFSGVTARVSARPHLIAMKLLARDDRLRPQDFDDLRALLETARPEEIATTRQLLGADHRTRIRARARPDRQLRRSPAPALATNVGKLPEAFRPPATLVSLEGCRLKRWVTRTFHRRSTSRNALAERGSSNEPSRPVMPVIRARLEFRELYQMLRKRLSVTILCVRDAGLRAAARDARSNFHDPAHARWVWLMRTGTSSIQKNSQSSER